MSALNYGVLNVGFKIVKIFVETGGLWIPVADEEVVDGFECGKGRAVKNGQSMANEAKDTFEAVLGPQKEGFLIEGQGDE